MAAVNKREALGCGFIAAPRVGPGHATSMPADVVTDMPGNHRSSRLRRGYHGVTYSTPYAPAAVDAGGQHPLRRVGDLLPPIHADSCMSVRPGGQRRALSIAPIPAGSVSPMSPSLRRLA
ncbi:hypothetical protein CEK65_18915 [Xanthomonas sp. LMG 12459]|nr:hypothetical protein CEK65_18915 [Xanthomonas sp. LMG 12459]